MLPIIIISSVFISVGLVLFVSLLFSMSAFKKNMAEQERISRGVVVQDKSKYANSETFLNWVPRSYVNFLEKQLVLAGRPEAWSLTRILLAKPIVAFIAALISIWWVSSDPQPLKALMGILLVVLGFFVPDLLLYSRATERQKQISLELPDTLDQMTIAVEAGLGFDSAMAKTSANGTGPLAAELVRTLQDMSLGRSRKDAYLTLAERTTSQDLRRFTRAIIQADTYGIAVSGVLRIQAAEMRLKRRQRAEERAMKIPVLVVFPLTVCILPVLFIVLLTPAVLNIVDAFS